MASNTKAVVVTSLSIYPIKSAQAVAQDSITARTMGIDGDRQFAIWADEKLVEQKHTPKVAAISATFDEAAAALTLIAAGHEPMHHKVRAEGEALDTTWVLDEFTSVDQGDEAAGWLSEVLAAPVRLVTPGPAWDINFPIEVFAPLHGKPKRSFTAASPIGIANQASLDELNKHLDHPVPMDRMRMNVVIEGLDAYEEDQMVSLSNGSVVFGQVAAAERCVIVTTDQTTGERPNNNLMQVLSTHRKKPKAERFASGLMFGNYMTVDVEGELHVGDTLTAQLT